MSSIVVFPWPANRCRLCGAPAHPLGSTGYVRHDCPHGRPCVTGSYLRGQGITQPPDAGPFYCADCFKAGRADGEVETKP